MAYFGLQKVWTKKVDLIGLLKTPSKAIPTQENKIENQIGKRNFEMLFQKKLVHILALSSQLNNLPVKPKNINDKPLVFDNNVYLLRNKVGDSKGIGKIDFIYYPSLNDKGKKVAIGHPFFIVDLEIDKASLYKIFKNPRELQLILEVIEACESFYLELSRFVHFTKEGGDVKEYLLFDSSKLTQVDANNAVERWRHLQSSNGFIDIIRNNIKELREKYDSHLVAKTGTN